MMLDFSFITVHNGDIQHASVQYIIDTVVDQLQHNADRRFIYVEMAFFSRWWREQDDVTRHLIKGLVNSGL
jgi:lysosomal alpha-mannosidase